MQRNIRTFAGVSLLCVTLSAKAVGPGFYMGIMTGPASNTGSSVQAQVEGSSATVPAKPTSKQWGSRIFMGNKFNPYAGWEGGATFYSSIHYDTSGVDTCSGLTTNVRDLSMMARGSFPFRSVELFGKAGVSYVYTTYPGAFYEPAPGNTCGAKTRKSGFKPTFSVGVGYDLTQNWVVDLSYTRTLVGGFVKNMDLLGVSISYHFVDVYCGQFLCDY